MTIRKLLIRQQLGGLGTLATRPFGHATVACYFCETFLYGDVCWEQNITLTYGERFTKCTVIFCKLQITYTRKSYIGIKLKSMCGLCQPGSLLCIISSVVGTFLGPGTLSWTM